MMATRKRRGGSRNLQKPSDDGGCLLLLLLVAWGLGFVSFHSRETGRTIARAAELREELANADKRLAELTAVVTAIREQSLDLDKEALQELEWVRSFWRAEPARRSGGRLGVVTGDSGPAGLKAGRTG